MQLLLMKGQSGNEVSKLAKALKKELNLSQELGKTIDDNFDAAIRRWQAGIGIIADGVVGPRCQVLLGLTEPQGDKFGAIELNVANVSQLFPATKPANIARYLPYIEAALGVMELVDWPMVIGALGTIRAETEGFVPISEFQSKFNTPPGGAPFSLYDKKLGNKGPGEGARYRGRGFVQLTGRANYKNFGDKIGCDLEQFPDLANSPEIAAVLLATYLNDNAAAFRAAVLTGKLDKARKIVNGGVHGLDRFENVFKLASAKWHLDTAKKLAGEFKPAVVTAERKAGRTKDVKTKKDAADLRDRLYTPLAISLPNEYPTHDEITQFLPAYTKAKLILNQGHEGACTGFGLACVINYLRWMKSGLPKTFSSVSPRMLYALARRHDEYEGENYEGSSCRGAIKGWFNNGVCLEEDWPYAPNKSNPAKYGFAVRAAETTLGVYYRVDTKSITDLQSAIAQHRAIFVSVFTHEGWDKVVTSKKLLKNHGDLPLIPFDGRPSSDGGHAFALVGFNSEGFVLQNSWGEDWGVGGFAVITYLDWLANAMDAWVVALGVPKVIAGRLAVSDIKTDGVAGADQSKWWDKGRAYQHSVVLGNDGRIKRYLTEDEQPRKLQQQVFSLPDQWFRTQPKEQKKRLVLMVHGGLNSEDDAVKRASAMGRFFINNGCYPIFIVWKTGILETVGNIIADASKAQPGKAGFGEWITEKTDLLIEKTIARPYVRPVWSEMKENADLAFMPRRGGELLLDAIDSLAQAWGEAFELHVIGHSAGSIFIGHMLSAITKRTHSMDNKSIKQTLKSIHLYAPACTVAFANKHFAQDDDVMKSLYLDVLNDKSEKDDNVIKIYRKSLLCLVSNALEADIRTPILGLDCINDPSYNEWDGTSDTGDELKNWRRSAEDVSLHKRTSLIANNITVAIDSSGKEIKNTPSHGGFDNDIDVVTRTIKRIIGTELPSKIDDLRGY